MLLYVLIMYVTYFFEKYICFTTLLFREVYEICMQRNINFGGQLSSWAHFIDNLMLIKNLVGTMSLKFLVSLLQVGCITGTTVYHVPPYKSKTILFYNLLGIIK